MEKYTVISTFAGCGGSSLGYEMAGFKELLAIDFNKNSAEIFKLNFPHVPILVDDISKVTGNYILGICNLKKGDLDVLDGSPPCQGFSTEGKRKVNDVRNDLFKEFVRLVIELNPKIFVMENVTGMIKGIMKGKFNLIMQSLKSLGYNVKCKKMNAKFYEVPQSRERLIFIGIRNDLKQEPVYPDRCDKIITVKEAFKSIADPGLFATIRSYMKFVKVLLQGQATSDVHPNKFGFSLRRLELNKPSFTIIKTCTSAAGLIHPIADRLIGINELLLLSSFPLSFKYPQKNSTNRTVINLWNAIGNSVPPKMMYHIAKTLKEKILDRQGYL